MSFFIPMKMMKKRFKFQVTLHLEELCSVPFMTGSLYCKVRLRDGGNFTENTNWSDVKDHTVTWRKKFVFSCKMCADPNTGVLDSCNLRISVRKEAKGGKSSVKVGLVDLNLAEFAGSNHTTRHCLLEPYQDRSRQDNSLLKVIIGMHLLSGDPCFKIPTVRDTALPLPDDIAKRERREGSDSSGFGSLPRKVSKDITPHTHQNSFEPGHSRNTSSASQQSKLSDYDSKHSRTPSNTSQASSPGGSHFHADGDSSHQNTQKLDVVVADRVITKTTPPPRPPPPRNAMRHPLDLAQDDRMGVTRVSADDIINKIMADQDFTHNTTADDDGGLRLYVSSDGTTALGGESFYNRGGNTMFQPVVIDPAHSETANNAESIVNR